MRIEYHNSIEFEGDNNDENEETNRGVFHKCSLYCTIPNILIR